MPTQLEALTQGLFAACDERLGDTITITPPAAAAITIAAHVDFGEERVGYSNSAAVTQAISVDLDASLVPGKPIATWRVTFARLPGKLFAPIDAERDESGLRWVFGVKTVNA